MINKAVSETENDRSNHRFDGVSAKQLASWKKDFHWLVVEGEGVEMRLKCTFCIECNVTTVWARDGSCNVQRDTIVKHKNSAEHEDAEKKILTRAEEDLFRPNLLKKLIVKNF